jgi:hypothetical protein
LKNKLIASDPSKFGAVIPCKLLNDWNLRTATIFLSIFWKPVTSRPKRPGEEDGRAYHFTTPAEMNDDIIQHKYLEFGEFDGYNYGTKLESIRQVIQSGRMCILDCSPAVSTSSTRWWVSWVLFFNLGCCSFLFAGRQDVA